MAPIGSRRPQLTAFRTPWVYIKKIEDRECFDKTAVLDGMPKANSEGNSCSVLLNDNNDIFLMEMETLLSY